MMHKLHNNEIQKELIELNSSLARANKPTYEKIPDGYFDNLYDRINNQANPAIVTIKRRLPLKWIASIAASVVIVLSFIWTINTNSISETDINDEIISYLKEDNLLYNGIIGDSDINIEDLNDRYLVEEDIEAYLIDHIDDLDIENIKN